MIAPLKIQLRLIRREVPILIGVTLLFSQFALGGGFHRLEGAVLLGLTVAYLVYVVRGAKKQDSDSVAEEFAESADEIAHKSNPVALFGFWSVGAYWRLALIFWSALAWNSQCGWEPVICLSGSRSSRSARVCRTGCVGCGSTRRAR